MTEVADAATEPAYEATADSVTEPKTETEPVADQATEPEAETAPKPPSERPPRMFPKTLTIPSPNPSLVNQLKNPLRSLTSHQRLRKGLSWSHLNR